MKIFLSAVSVFLIMTGFVAGVFYPSMAWLAVLGLALLGVVAEIDKKDQLEKEWEEYKNYYTINKSYVPRHAKKF